MFFKKGTKDKIAGDAIFIRSLTLNTMCLPAMFY